MPSILFICRANLFRSPIAAAAMRRCLRNFVPNEDWVVDSAGTWTTAGQFPMPEAIRAAARHDLDIRGHTSKPVTSDRLTACDLIITMERGQREALLTEFPMTMGKVYLLSQVGAGKEYDIPDPFLENTEDGDPSALAGEVIQLVENGFDTLCDLAKGQADSRNISRK